MLVEMLKSFFRIFFLLFLPGKNFRKNLVKRIEKVAGCFGYLSGNFIGQKPVR
jgi:hypothetical protein